MSSPKPTLDDLRIERSPEPESTSRFWPVAIGILVLALAVALGLVAEAAGSHPVRTVLVREASGNGIERTVLNASGYVTARRQATVSSKITGKVVEVLVEEGMKVQEGQVLARLDDTNVKTSLRLAEAQLVSATNALAETRVRLREADQELQRQTGLVKNKIATQADYDHAEAALLALQGQLEQQQADVMVAEKQVAYWDQQLDDTIIRAPFTGIVTSKNAQPGEMISPISAGGGFTRTGICTIVDMESLEIEIDVNESYINRVRAGQAVEATLDAYPDWKIPCKVIAIIPDRRPAEVHREGAGRVRQARSAHPAGDEREGRLPRGGRLRAGGRAHCDRAQSSGAAAGRARRGAGGAKRARRAPGGDGEQDAPRRGGDQRGRGGRGKGDCGRPQVA